MEESVIERKTFNQVFAAELDCLRPEHSLYAPSLSEGRLSMPASYEQSPIEIDSELKRVFHEIGNWSAQHRLAASAEPVEPPVTVPASQAAALPEPLTALCLSGGGVRSAIFNLGVLQAFAEGNLLGKFDYLSGVSGGAHIASWLCTWMHREGVDEVVDKLKSTRPDGASLAPEPEPVAALRSGSAHLLPGWGLFSGDTWSALATVSSNVLLNWLVFLPIVAAVLGMPLLFMMFINTPEISMSPPVSRELLVSALGLQLLANGMVFWKRRLQSGRLHSDFIWACVLLICLSATTLSAGARGANLPGGHSASGGMAVSLTVSSLQVWAFCFFWCALVPLVSRLIVEVITSRLRASGGHSGLRSSGNHARVQWMPEIQALLISGMIEMCALVAITHWWFPYFADHPVAYTILAVPILLAIYVISRIVFIAIDGLRDEHLQQESSAGADRDWWSRLCGWVLFAIVGWIALTAVSLLNDYLPQWATTHFGFVQSLFGGEKAGGAAPGGASGWAQTLVQWAIAALGGVSGLIAVLAGNGAQTSAAATNNQVRLLLVMTALFVICLVMTLSSICAYVIGSLDLLLGYAHSSPPMPNLRVAVNPLLGVRTLVEFFGTLIVFALLGVWACRFVDVNRFSVHGWYCTRLSRLYLGASNHSSPSGELPLHRLSKPHAPLLLINSTVNLTAGEKLTVRERRASSFSMTPLYCGNWALGYRASRWYGAPDGISVGTAMTISGAAADPNLGYVSSPVVSFLMALFNLRLGAWLGNTNNCGKRSFDRPGPRRPLLTLLADMLGMSTAHSSYINLSDGGHFDALGLYEAVLRRCRYIVVSDAGCDPGFTFEDLGNCVRKIRIDFGINVEFGSIRILPNGSTQQGLSFAHGRIRYSAVDGSSEQDDGVLIYLKPTLRGEGIMPLDIYSYQRSNAAFPHDRFADEWFAESLFESYRALGLHIGRELLEPMTTTMGPDWRQRAETLSAARLLEICYQTLRQREVGRSSHAVAFPP
jgi:hypothetical protein